jgi:hypothetical protein
MKKMPHLALQATEIGRCDRQSGWSYTGTVQLEGKLYDAPEAWLASGQREVMTLPRV